MKHSVFISYRREGGSEKAELVRGELLRRGFRKRDLFMDTHDLGEGRYPEKLEEAVNNSTCLVVIITKGCFNGLSDSSNWIREIRQALDLKKRVIPIYLDGIQELAPSDIPDSLAQFPKENAVLYVHQYASASFDMLASRIKEGMSWKMPLWGKIASGGAAAAATAAIIGTMGHANLKDGEVIIVDSPSSECYHLDRDCRSLHNSKKLKTITLEEAIKMGKRPCKNCVGKK